MVHPQNFTLFLLFLCLSWLTKTYASILSRDDSGKIRSVVSFGDSYLDNGSFDYLYEGSSNKIDPTSLHPYSSKTISRASDGPMSVEYLAAMLNDAELYNFARKAGKVNNSLLSSSHRKVQDLICQVDHYFSSNALSVIKNESVYILWIGGNDLDEIFKVYQNTKTIRTDLIDGVLQTMRNELTRIYTSYSHFIVMARHPLQDMPMNHNLVPDEKQVLTKMVLYFNDYLKHMVDNFKCVSSQECDKVDNVQFFDAYTLFKTLFTPEEIEYNSAHHCGHDPKSHAGPKNCDKFIWANEQHPSANTNSKIARALYEFMQELEWI